MSENALQQAKALLDEMKQQAANGTMVPVRVPGQIDAIADLLAQADEAAAAPPPAPAVPADVDAVRADNAEFMSIAVHEMRVPLTSIRGYADMIAKGMLGELNEQQQQFMSIIQSNTLRLERLISDINDLTKIKAERLHLEPRMDMAKNVLLMAQKAVEGLAEERQMQLVFDVPDGLPLLNVDGPRVAQALRYLVENALQYAPEGSTVTVTARGEGSRLAVSVVDSGIGMTPDELARLGEPFWRAENDTVRAFKGHGLGYAVAQGLIAHSGGAIAVESTPGEGSTFSFSLPGMQ